VATLFLTEVREERCGVIIRTRGYILDKQYMEGVSVGDTWVPDRYWVIDEPC
jgi:hypothetical protein